MSAFSWIGNLFAKVVGLFHKVEKVADDIFKVADSFVNKVKVLEQSEVGQFIEKEITDLFPQFKGLEDAIKIWFPRAAGLLANVEDTVHSDEAKIEAFLAHLATLKANAPTLYAGALNTLNADLQQLLAGNTGVVQLTPQMSLAGSQLAHDPTLGGALDS